MFRCINLAGLAPGALYLHSMPGRYEPLEDTLQTLSDLGISDIICLAPLAEIKAKSRCYAEVLESDGLPCSHRLFPIPDYGTPTDRGSFASEVEAAAGALRRGDRILVHCGAGIGRTGLFAAGVLVALGLEHTQALRRVEEAGSHPERDEQYALLEWYASMRS
jgi:protein-tyrosine phosphatase